MTSPIGFGGPQGGGDNGAEFESFRQKRQSRRFKTDGSLPAPVADAKSKLQRAIEAEERKEMVERQLAREVQEFVEETTRLAASILNQVSTEEQKSHHQQISQEMKEFFHATLHRAEHMLESLKSMQESGASVAELEATLTNLSTHKLDEFRAEGSESLRDAHLGEAPLLKPIEGHVEPEAPAAGALQMISKSSGWQEIEGQTEAHANTEEEYPIEDDLEEDGSCDMEPLGEDFEFISETGDEHAASGAWRAEQDEEEPSEESLHEVTVETEFAADFVDDSEEDALAADPEEADDFPPFFRKWRHDKPALKKALTVMVKNGLMTPEEARSIFTRA